MDRLKRGGELILDLPNGLTARFFDASKPVAGDRSQVVLKIEIKVSVTGDDPAAEFVRRLVGPELTYGHAYERNFIDDSKVEDLLNQMAAKFEASQLPYLSRPDFATRFIAAEAAKIKRDPYKYGLSPEKIASITR